MKLTDEQKKKVAELQKKMHEEFLKILTPEQRQQLEKMKKGPRAKDQGPPRKGEKSPSKTTAWQELRGLEEGHLTVSSPHALSNATAWQGLLSSRLRLLEHLGTSVWTALQTLPTIWRHDPTMHP